MRLADALRDVEIGGKVVPFAQHHGPSRRIGSGDSQRRREHLEQVDRGAVGSDHLVRLRADQWRNPRAYALWHIEPPSVVPGADQPLPPLLMHDLRRPRRSATR